MAHATVPNNRKITLNQTHGAYYLLVSVTYFVVSKKICNKISIVILLDFTDKWLFETSPLFPLLEQVRGDLESGDTLIYMNRK